MNHKTAEELIAFETRIKGIFEAGELPFLLHLAGGNEEQLVEVFSKIKDGDWVFGSHRSHFHALLSGMSEEEVEAKIRAGDSMFLFSRARNFYTSAILAGTPCIAAGVAWQLKQEGSASRVHCFIGDGAEDNSNFCEAVRFSTARDLPIQFIIEDNGFQVDTSYLERWGTNERFYWGEKVTRYFYERKFPHAGRGPGKMIEFKPEIVHKLLGETPKKTHSPGN